MTCSACRSHSPSDFTFCPRCGCEARAGAMASSATPAHAGEDSMRRLSPVVGQPDDDTDRRQVTVLFADLSGFTSLSERLDPEEVRGIQVDLFEALTSVVRRYDGFVEKFAGDAVMAVFGAPVAHEADPQRALHSALAMHKKVEALNSEWETRLGHPLLLHVGIDTGEVVAGTYRGSDEPTYIVTGDPVNTAARLQSAAGPGETFVSEATHRQAPHGYRFDALGGLEIRGKAEGIQVFRLLGHAAETIATRGLERFGLSAPMVGREEELGQMRAVFDRMMQGRAQVVRLVGDTGVGKSRLVTEFLARISKEDFAEPVTIRRCVCASIGGRAYGVLAYLIGDAFRIDPDDDLETVRERVRSGLRSLGVGRDEIDKITPAMVHLMRLGSEEGLQHVEPRYLRRKILHAVLALCERRLEEGPLVMVVDNLQWADTASLEVFRFLMDRLEAKRVMLLVDHRTSFSPQPLLDARIGHSTILVDRLSDEDCETILRAYFGGSFDDIPGELVELVLKRAGGRPLYVEEIIRGLRVDGTLVQVQDRWSCPAGVATADVPDTIKALLIARVDRLHSDARRLLQETAVLGQRFDSRLLDRFTGLRRESLERAMDLLIDKGFLEEIPDPTGTHELKRYRFPHELTREVVYGSMLFRNRAEMHVRVEVALEMLDGVGVA